VAGGERSSPGASSLPATDSPTSYQNEDEEFEEEPYDGITEEAYSQIYGRSANPYGSKYQLLLNNAVLCYCILVQLLLICLTASYFLGVHFDMRDKEFTIPR
jgi:BTB/POZ domain-containing protein 14